MYITLNIFYLYKLCYMNKNQQMQYVYKWDTERSHKTYINLFPLYMYIKYITKCGDIFTALGISLYEF